MLKNYIKIAWRQLKNKQNKHIINISGLAFSLSAVILISLWIRDEMDFDRHHPDVGHKYLIKNSYIYDNGNAAAQIYSPFNAVEKLQNEYPEIEQVAYCNRGYQALKVNVGGNLFSEKSRLYVSKNWFDFMHYDFIQKDLKSFLEHRNSIILSEQKARQYFGSTDIVGQTIKIDSVDHVVRGVIENTSSRSSFDFDLLLPIDEAQTLMESANWMYFTAIVFIQLHPKAHLAQLEQQIDRLFTDNIKWTQSGISNKTQLTPLRDMHFDSTLPQAPFYPKNIQVMVIFSTLGLLLLLIASINYINLTLAQAFSRIKEFGARKVVGARKSHVFGQLFFEAAMNASIAFLLALVIVHIALPVFNDFFQLNLQLDFLSIRIITLLVGLWVALILLSGLYPAFHLSSVRAMHLFKGTGMLQFTGKNIRKGLLIVQVLLAFLMVVSSLTMYHQLTYIQKRDDTYDKSQVFMVKIPETFPPLTSSNHWEEYNQHRNTLKNSLKNSLLQYPEIVHVSTTINYSVIDYQSHMVGQLNWAGKNPDFQPQYTVWPVDDEIYSILNMKLLKGRWFNPGDSVDYKNIVLNDAAVKHFAIPDPVIGQEIDNNGKKGVIVGIVKDFHFQSMHTKIGPLLMHKKNLWGNHLIIQAKGGNAVAARKKVEQVFKQKFPDDVFSSWFLDEEFDSVYLKDQQTLYMAFGFSVISIVLSLIGLLGMVMFDIQSRTKEIGIRKVLGASVSSIVNLLSKDFVKLVLIAIVIASPIAWWAMNKWLEDFAYHIEIQWWMFGLAGLCAVSIALLTVGFQAVKAATANPVESLRDE